MFMKKAFYASLCHNGIRGGAVFIKDDCVIYRNQTLTLEEEYKNIVIPISDIAKIETSHIFVFPTVALTLKNNRKYKFVIFNRNTFLDIILNKKSRLPA